MTQPEFEVFFDGECPLCKREVDMIRRFDRKKRIGFLDISLPDFDARDHGLDQERLMATLHARLQDGTMVDGVEVFRRMYAAIGLGPLVWFTRLPGISHAADAAYEVFAKNRLRLTGRCAPDGTCAVAPR